jgi:methyl-accepting chemotaxis protein
MQNAQLITAFIIIAAVAILIQACILIAMYLAMRKSSARMEALANEMKNKILPTAEVAHSMLVEMRPKIENVIDNVGHSATMVRAHMERLDATVNDIIDRTRLQVIRADELLNRTMDRVEETTDMVHRTVTSPVRKLSGLAAGVGAGLDFLLGGKRRQRNGVSVPQDEMFI